MLLEQTPWLLALLIFAARVVDVSLGTVRTILVIRGLRFPAAFIGFFEILIWVSAVSQVIQNLDAWYLAIAYAGGFATGNVVGIWLESRLAIGTELIRAISNRPDVPLASLLRERRCSVLELDGHGDEGAPVEVLLIVERRKRVPELLEFILAADPTALCTVSDVKRQTRTPSQGFRAELERRGPEGAFRAK